MSEKYGATKAANSWQHVFLVKTRRNSIHFIVYILVAVHYNFWFTRQSGQKKKHSDTSATVRYTTHRTLSTAICKPAFHSLRLSIFHGYALWFTATYINKCVIYRSRPYTTVLIDRQRLPVERFQACCLEYPIHRIKSTKG